MHEAVTHKYEAGQVAIIVGTYPGAALLAAKAAFRTGAGIVRLFSPNDRLCEGIIDGKDANIGDIPGSPKRGLIKRFKDNAVTRGFPCFNQIDS